MKNYFGSYLDQYRSDLDETGSVEKLLSATFQRFQSRPDPIDIRRDTAQNSFSEREKRYVTDINPRDQTPVLFKVLSLAA